MKEFLNRNMANNRDFELFKIADLKTDFENAIIFIHETLGEKAFRLERGVHSAIFDSVMIGVTLRLRKGKIVDKGTFLKSYHELIENKEFSTYYSSATSDDNSVKNRI